jgi:hypothetical protein
METTQSWGILDPNGASKSRIVNRGSILVLFVDHLSRHHSVFHRPINSAAIKDCWASEALNCIYRKL